MFLPRCRTLHLPFPSRRTQKRPYRAERLPFCSSAPVTAPSGSHSAAHLPRLARRAGTGTSLCPKLGPGLGCSSPRRGVLALLLAEPPAPSTEPPERPALTKNVSSQERSVALCLFAAEMRRGKTHGDEERKRQLSTLAGSGEGSGATQTAAREGAAGRGAASRLSTQAPAALTLLLGKGFQTRALGQERAAALRVGFPALQGGQQQRLAPAHLWTACVRPVSLPSKRARGFGACLTGPPSVYVLRSGSLRQAAAWWAPQMASAKQSCRASGNCNASVQPDARLPAPRGSAAQHPLRRHLPAVLPTLLAVQTSPLLPRPKIVAPAACLLSSACGQSVCPPRKPSPGSS